MCRNALTAKEVSIDVQTPDAQGACSNGLLKGRRATSGTPINSRSEDIAMEIKVLELGCSKCPT